MKKSQNKAREKPLTLCSPTNFLLPPYFDSSYSVSWFY